jgi:hypothetical protein
MLIGVIMEIISCRVSKEMETKILRLSKKRKESFSETIRFLIEKNIDHQFLKARKNKVISKLETRLNEKLENIDGKIDEQKNEIIKLKNHNGFQFIELQRKVDEQQKELIQLKNHNGFQFIELQRKVDEQKKIILELRKNNTSLDNKLDIIQAMLLQFVKRTLSNEKELDNFLDDATKTYRGLLD